MWDVIREDKRSFSEKKNIIKNTINLIIDKE